MKKNLLFTILLALGLLGNLNAQKTLTIGDGNAYSSDLPYNNSYCYSSSQQIYTSDELSKIEGVATIESLAFKSATENLNESYIQVYMLNTTKTSFEEGDSWFELSDDNKVYEGYIHTTGLDQWTNISLTTPFVYSGNNVLVCVNICVEYYLSSNDQDQYYTYSPAEGNASSTIRSNTRIDVTNVSAELKENAQVSAAKNQIQLGYSQSSSDINVNFKSIDFGDVALGEYWSENKENAGVVVSAASYYTKITEVTCSDSFFVLSEIDYTKSPVQFVLSCDKNATAGEKTAELTITDDASGKVVIPVTANVYDPVTPDVFELAQEVTFTDGVYKNTPDFATLHDDYLLPNERFDSNAPDAVYALTIEEETMVLVDVDGTNAKVALYAEDFGGKEGPMSDNVYSGDEKVLSTTFSYDFENESLNDFTIEDYDEYENYTWKVENGTLVSYSFVSAPEPPYYVMNKADERITTKELYTITPNSVLTFDVRFAFVYDETQVFGNYDNVYVQITKDGTTFTEIAFVESVVDMSAPNGYSIDWLSQRVDLGAKLTELGLDYGDYQISFYHKFGGAHILAIDNFALTERDKVVLPGNYYLVVAAEDAFDVTVSLGEIPEDDEPDPSVPAAPTNLRALVQQDLPDFPNYKYKVTFLWDAVEGADGYEVYVNTADTSNFLMGTSSGTAYICGANKEATLEFYVVTVIDSLVSAPSEICTVVIEDDAVEELTSSFNIYPNPVGNELFITAELNVEEISVYDVYGRQAMNQQVNESTRQQVINVADLKAGIYFVKIKAEGGEVVKRFIKN